MNEADRGFINRSLVQLTLVRFREFIRQPEAVFWTFVFPILLAVGLGLAFRSKAPDRVKVGVVTTQPDAARIIASLKRDSSLIVEELTRCRDERRKGPFINDHDLYNLARRWL